MNPFKEQLLLEKLKQNHYFISITGNIPDDVSSLTNKWFDKNVKNTGKKILDLSSFITLYNLVEEEYDKSKYKNERKNIYPSIEEQLDMIYWDMINGTTKWKDLISEIKNQYPKL